MSYIIYSWEIRFAPHIMTKTHNVSSVPSFQLVSRLISHSQRISRIRGYPAYLEYPNYVPGDISSDVWVDCPVDV